MEGLGALASDRAVDYRRYTPLSMAFLSGLNQFRRWLWVLVRPWLLPVLAGAMLGGGIAFAGARAVQPEYRATAQLYLTTSSASSATSQDATLAQSLARNYVQLATADGVLRPAMERTLPSTDIERFRERTLISQVKDTSLINVSFRYTNPQLAADAANAIAESFIEQNRIAQSSLESESTSQLDDQIKSAGAEVKSVDAQLVPLREALAATAPPGQSATRATQQAQLLALEESRQSKLQTLSQLVRARDDTRLAAARSHNALGVWQAAIPPRRPETPNVVLNTALGTFGGTLLAFISVGVARYRDDRLADAEAVTERLGLEAIAEVPRARRPASLEGKLFVRDQPHSLQAEAVSSLRTSIFFANAERPPHTILVTSAMPLEGKSVISANLALAFARAGTSTVLLDADLRRPSQHILFGTQVTPGVMNLLTGDFPIGLISQMRVAPNLIVVPSGPVPPNAAEVLSSERMTAFIKKLQSLSVAGALIIDTSPLLLIAGASALAATVDGCLLVVDSRRTTTRVARRAIEILRQVRAPILGVVLNKVPEAEGGSYYSSDYQAPTSVQTSGSDTAAE